MCCITSTLLCSSFYIIDEYWFLSIVQNTHRPWVLYFISWNLSFLLWSFPWQIKIHPSSTCSPRSRQRYSIVKSGWMTYSTAWKHWCISRGNSAGTSRGNFAEIPRAPADWRALSAELRRGQWTHPRTQPRNLLMEVVHRVVTTSFLFLHLNKPSNLMSNIL